MRRQRVTLDPEEYAALCHLRDVTHEALRVRLIATETQRAELIGINQQQVARLVRQDLELAQVRAEVERLRAEIVAIKTKAPVASEVRQPLYASGPKVGGR